MRINCNYGHDDYVSIFHFKTDDDEGISVYWTIDGVATQVILQPTQLTQLIRLLQQAVSTITIVL